MRMKDGYATYKLPTLERVDSGLEMFGRKRGKNEKERSSYNSSYGNLRDSQEQRAIVSLPVRVSMLGRDDVLRYAPSRCLRVVVVGSLPTGRSGDA